MLELAFDRFKSKLEVIIHFLVECHKGNVEKHELLCVFTTFPTYGFINQIP